MSGKKRLVVFSGSGVSQESGISTFRDNGGLWDQHRIEDVATPEAWAANQALVMEFYNQRRKQLFEVEPNAAHHSLAELEDFFDITIVTQNVDDLHERAGSSKVIHLHGELKKVRSSVDPSLIYEMDSWELKAGDTCEKGSQLRPHIVWFGEEVPMMPVAYRELNAAEILIVVGTSLNVYPAAGLVDDAPDHAIKFLIDPKQVQTTGIQNITHIQKKATDGMAELKARLIEQFA